jgi:hypothetical protein
MTDSPRGPGGGHVPTPVAGALSGWLAGLLSSPLAKARAPGVNVIILTPPCVFH